jgi:hypothetical protein
MGMTNATADQIDIVELTDDGQCASLGYEPGTRGFVVQVDGQWEADASDLDAAARIATDLVGAPVNPVQEPANYGPRWTVRA